MTEPIQWRSTPPPGVDAAFRAELRTMSIRAALWSGTLGLVILAALGLIVPGVPLSIGLVLWPSLVLPAGIYLAALMVPTGRDQVYQLTDDGFLLNGRRRRFGWRHAIGWGFIDPDRSTLLLVGKGGMLTRLEAPTVDEREAVTAALGSRLRELPSDELAEFAAPVMLSRTDAVALSACTLVSALVAGAAFPPLLKALNTGVALTLVVSLGCTPTIILALVTFRRRFPRLRAYLAPLASILFLFALGPVTLIAAAFLRRAID